MVDCVFDLKGSLIGRLTKDVGAKNDTILKDLNIRIKRGHKLVSIVVNLTLMIASSNSSARLTGRVSLKPWRGTPRFSVSIS